MLSPIIYIDGLRQLFCMEIMKCKYGEEASIVEKMMLADTKLWKSARVQSHQLYMAGLVTHLGQHTWHTNPFTILSVLIVTVNLINKI